MTNFKTKLTTAIATGSVLLQAMAPVTFAQQSFVISGNGDSADSEISIERESEVTVNQENDADIDNDIEVNASTGDNTASRNTGGDSSIDTGDATTEVTVTNQTNVNHAQVSDCAGCAGQDVSVEISKNGVDTDNEVDLEFENEVDIEQDNDADIDNDVDVDVETGDNEASRNTNGSASITTGDADTTVSLRTLANSNSAVVGGGDEEGELDLLIANNGDSSDNEIDFEFDNEVVVEQDNDADVENDVDVDAETGDNDASRNTGDDVSIDTGDANADVTVDNMVNFNFADASCGCVFDIDAEISKNGVQSDNEIEGEFDDELEVEQDNDADLDNDVDVDGDTGDNDAERNTGDPEITTGDADATVEVSNESNANVYGAADMDLEFDWDLGELQDFLSWLMNLYASSN